MSKNITSTLRKLKPFMLPIAIALGIIFHNIAGRLTPLSPILIFVMLFITFCRINPRDIRVTRLSFYLILIQIAGAMGAFYLISPLSLTVAQGVMICIYCPTATAAPVITGMLGGSIPKLVTYSLVSNLAVAVTAPFLLPIAGGSTGELTVGEMIAVFHRIAVQVVPLIVAPLALAFIVKALFPKVHHEIGTHQSLGFYTWAISLLIVVGSAVSFVMSEPWSRVPEMIVIALAAGVACGIQFYAGRRIGRACGDRIAGAQGLGQKNTVLAIWLALAYLDPIASVGPAAYIAWQNTINSLQIYYHDRRALG